GLRSEAPGCEAERPKGNCRAQPPAPSPPSEPAREARPTEMLKSTWLGAEASPKAEEVDEYETGLLRRRRTETLSTPGAAIPQKSLWERLHALGPERFRLLADEVGLYHLAAVLHAVPAALVDELAGWLGVFRGRNLKLQLNWASSLSEQELKKCEAEVEQALAQL
ncbi:MAG: hypothetical protein KC910_09445, partial [Candidatus Eremiobacteraeota bacterium]|nr:hypothetical protein [Candidatus Eremiobacteraeota bacterium]